MFDIVLIIPLEKARSVLKVAISKILEVLRSFGEFTALSMQNAPKSPYFGELSNVSFVRTIPELACFLRGEIAARFPSGLTARGRALTLRFADGRRHLDRRTKMLVPVSIMIVASQLVITVADRVPKFDIARGCRVDSASAFDPNAGMRGTIKRCVTDEQRAKNQLQTQWSGFAESDRAMCTSETAGEKDDDSSNHRATLNC